MHLDTESSTWILRFDNPPVNAFSPAQFDAAFAFLERAEADRDCRSLVIAGAGQVFSAGVDIHVLKTLDVEGLKRLIRNINLLSLELFAFPKPVVAAVEGHAIGLGAVIIAASDFRIAARGDYRIGLNELDAGLPFPACAAEALLASLSPSSVRRLCLGAQLYQPEHPLLAELIDQVVAPEEVMSRAMAMAGERGAQAVYADIKLQLRGMAIARMREIIEHDADPLLQIAEDAIERFRKT